MRLTRYTDYALRVLIFAALNPRALSTIDAISAGYGVSKNHLRKVVHDSAGTASSKPCKAVTAAFA